MTHFTESQAVTEFFEIRGDGDVDTDMIETAVREIGNPEAYLPVVKTAETADDFRENGWNDYRVENGVVWLKKGTTTKFVHIADCGDYRLVWVDA